MQTADTSNLFRSDAEHARASYRAAKHALHADTGAPIQLSSKPLRVVVRPNAAVGKEADAWVAESGFIVRRVGLETGNTKQIYRGHQGPVTSLDFYTVPSSPSREVLLSGSWDKSIRVYDVASKAPLSTTLAHIDFVKALLVIPSLQIVVSGSSDRDIRVWDLSTLASQDFTSTISAFSSSTAGKVKESPVVPVPSAEPPSFDKSVPVPTGAAPPTAKSSNPLPLLFSLKAHTRPVERLAHYSITSPSASDDEQGSPTGRIGLVSVDSLGALKTWELWRDDKGVVKGELRTETRPHEIAIYDLVIGDGEIWTASADNSILLSSFSPSSPELAPLPTLRIPHPSHVKSLLSLGLSLPSLGSPHVLTGSSDELIRIFDLSSPSLDESESTRTPWTGIAAPSDRPLPGCVREVDGHSHDVTDLGVYTKTVEGKKEAWILSASVDGTLRRWKWPDVLKEPEVKKILVPVEEEEEQQKENLLTEEEERELAELMQDE